MTEPTREASEVAGTSASGRLLDVRHRRGREHTVAALAGAGEEWTHVDRLPLAVLRVGEMQLACDPAVITMIVPLPQRFPSSPGMLDLAEGLGIALPEDDPFSSEQSVVTSSRAWQQLELRDGDIEVVVPEPPSVQPVPRACIARLPGLLSDPSRPHGSAIDGLLGLVCDAPGLEPIVWIVDLPEFAKRLLVTMGIEES